MILLPSTEVIVPKPAPRRRLRAARRAVFPGNIHQFKTICAVSAIALPRHTYPDTIAPAKGRSRLMKFASHHVAMYVANHAFSTITRDGFKKQNGRGDDACWRFTQFEVKRLSGATGENGFTLRTCLCVLLLTPRMSNHLVAVCRRPTLRLHARGAQ